MEKENTNIIDVIEEKLSKIKEIESKINHLKEHIVELSDICHWSLFIHKVGNNGDIPLNCEGFDKEILLKDYLSICNKKLESLYKELEIYIKLD